MDKLVTLTEHFVSYLQCALSMNIFPLYQSKVAKILWSQTTLPLVAPGVKFSPYTPGTTVRANAFARREVIIAIGAIKVLHPNAYALPLQLF